MRARVARPSHCNGCTHWEIDCREIVSKESVDKIIYGVRCGHCNQREKTCWMAILPDGWRISAPMDREKGLLCRACDEKYHEVFFDEKTYDVLERIEW